MANASLDSIPMVVIVGDVPSYYFGRHPHQEVQMHEDGDQYSMLKPVCKRSWRVDDVEALPYILDKAFRLAEAGRPGPVLVDVPMDMFSREMDEELWARTYKDSHVTMKPALTPLPPRQSQRSWWRPRTPSCTPAAASCWLRPPRSWLLWPSSWTSPCPALWPARAACPTSTP